jgi:hypothetical protein
VFDLFYFTLNLTAGQEQAELPGLLTTCPARRSARGRGDDRLILYASLTDSSALSHTQLDDILEKTAHAYYTSDGSVTAGLRTAAGVLNEFLFSRNVKYSRESSQAIALLNMAVIHNNLVYLAQAGPTHSFLLSNEGVKHFTDVPTSERGLGLSKSVNMRFFQSEIRTGDELILAAAPPENWGPDTLNNCVQLPLELMRRRLFNQSAGFLQAVVIQLQPGKGIFHHLKPRQVEQTSQPEVQPVAAAIPPEPGPVVAVISTPEPEQIPAPIKTQQAFQEPLPLGETSSDDSPDNLSTISTGATSAQPTLPKEKRIFLPGVQKIFRRGLASTGQAGLKAGESFNQGIKTLLNRMMPTTGNQTSAFSPTALLFIAIAVPVIIVAIATTVYFRVGRSEQHQVYLQQAQSFYDQADQESDATLKHQAWEQTLYWIDKAEKFGVSDASLALRLKTQQGLDKMDGISRLQLQPATTTSLPHSINITHIVATTNDIYLLDSNEGRVLRLFQTGQGFAYDPAFSCGPGPSGGKIINPLIGVVALPANNQFKASVMAIDSTANLVYCIPGSPALSTTLAPPDTNWGKITAITLNQAQLDVLDTQNNAVWRFTGDSMSFPDQPRMFFDTNIPNLSDTIDLASYEDELFILHRDGKMTWCTFSNFSFSPTKCKDPAEYYDAREGHDLVPLPFSENNFIQMQTTQPPDPSLYVLDGKASTIYHFSMRLNLQRELRPQDSADYPLPKSAITAFAITPSMTAILAYGNQVFYSPLP